MVSIRSIFQEIIIHCTSIAANIFDGASCFLLESITCSINRHLE